ncbi:CBS domain-containing protein [Sulfurospirillum arsenophilum]|uniref:CBS domain-containing protein n=1 Tax=Sulfurospirillum arsenophilum TaxID=56698 RepID=UPI000694BE7D|nr:CBS domain-containing protein [Sulfurospirillum arsenophilum]
MLKNLTISCYATVIEAIKRIDLNRKKFLLIVDDHNALVGILTDGDIRRLLIDGHNLNKEIAYNQDIIKITLDDDFNTLIELFKSEKITFIPIVDKENKLINVITKKQFHIMLLKDYAFDLLQVANIEEEELDYEIVSKPWGFYKSTLLAQHVQSKVVTLFPNEELSLQKHKQREEHWIITKGFAEITLEESKFLAETGRYIYIPTGCKHKIKNVSNSQNLIITEVQLGEYFGEDDIIRYEDKYGRIQK